MQEGFARLPGNMANAISNVSLTRNFKRKIDRNIRPRNMANAICEAIKSFFLRGRNRLENEGRPISLKSGVQSGLVGLCNMPKF